MERGSSNGLIADLFDHGGLQTSQQRQLLSQFFSQDYFRPAETAITTELLLSDSSAVQTTPSSSLPSADPFVHPSPTDIPSDRMESMPNEARWATKDVKSQQQQDHNQDHHCSKSDNVSSRHPSDSPIRDCEGPQHSVTAQQDRSLHTRPSVTKSQPAASMLPSDYTNQSVALAMHNLQVSCPELFKGMSNFSSDYCWNLFETVVKQPCSSDEPQIGAEQQQRPPQSLHRNSAPFLCCGTIKNDTTARQEIFPLSHEHYTITHYQNILVPIATQPLSPPISSKSSKHGTTPLTEVNTTNSTKGQASLPFSFTLESRGSENMGVSEPHLSLLPSSKKHFTTSLLSTPQLPPPSDMTKAPVCLIDNWFEKTKDCCIRELNRLGEVFLEWAELDENLRWHLNAVSRCEKWVSLMCYAKTLQQVARDLKPIDEELFNFNNIDKVEMEHQHCQILSNSSNKELLEQLDLIRNNDVLDRTKLCHTLSNENPNNPMSQPPHSSIQNSLSPLTSPRESESIVRSLSTNIPHSDCILEKNSLHCSQSLFNSPVALDTNPIDMFQPAVRDSRPSLESQSNSDQILGFSGKEDIHSQFNGQSAPVTNLDQSRHSIHSRIFEPLQISPVLSSPLPTTKCIGKQSLYYSESSNKKDDDCIDPMFAQEGLDLTPFAGLTTSLAAAIFFLSRAINVPISEVRAMLESSCAKAISRKAIEENRLERASVTLAMHDSGNQIKEPKNDARKAASLPSLSTRSLVASKSPSHHEKAGLDVCLSPPHHPPPSSIHTQSARSMKGVSFDRSKRNWEASWLDARTGRRVKKCFSEGRWGSSARDMAILARKEAEDSGVISTRQQPHTHSNHRIAPGLQHIPPKHPFEPLVSPTTSPSNPPSPLRATSLFTPAKEKLSIDCNNPISDLPLIASAISSSRPATSPLELHDQSCNNTTIISSRRRQRVSHTSETASCSQVIHSLDQPPPSQPLLSPSCSSTASTVGPTSPLLSTVVSSLVQKPLVDRLGEEHKNPLAEWQTKLGSTKQHSSQQSDDLRSYESLISFLFSDETIIESLFQQGGLLEHYKRPSEIDCDGNSTVDQLLELLDGVWSRKRKVDEVIIGHGDSNSNTNDRTFIADLKRHRPNKDCAESQLIVGRRNANEDSYRSSCDERKRIMVGDKFDVLHFK